MVYGIIPLGVTGTVVRAAGFTTIGKVMQAPAKGVAK